MKIIWFTWKDYSHPSAGGAETIGNTIAKKLVADGHKIIFIVAGYKGCSNEEYYNGYKIIRIGNRFTVYPLACLYYLKYLKKWPELVIEEINTFPFFTQFYSKTSRVLLIYQLCREIWFYQIFFPLNLIGYILEPIYLYLLRKNKTITESSSTKADLLNYGFNSRDIGVFSLGIEMRRLQNMVKKPEIFTLLSLGDIRSMKRTLDQVKAFEIAKEKNKNMKLILAGNIDGQYGRLVKNYIGRSKYRKDISVLGKVSTQIKIKLLRECHILLVTSVKEGWGLVVTEAASQGTPSLVYDVDGLRDSVKNKVTGIICKSNSSVSLAREIILVSKNQDLYKRLQKNCLKLSGEYTQAKSYSSFKKTINSLMKEDVL